MQSSARAKDIRVTKREVMMNKLVIAAVDDMFFASKIRAVAEHLGQKVLFVRNVDEALEAFAHHRRFARREVRPI
jgi:SpoU rRNA methylase family enzyme